MDQPGPRLRPARPEAAGGPPRTLGGRPRLDHGAELLASQFTSVTRRDFTSELLTPGPRLLQDYVCIQARSGCLIGS